MLPENQTNKNPDREENKTIPTSMANSGVNLDPCCEGGMDSGVDLSDMAGGAMDEADATKFMMKGSKR